MKEKKWIGNHKNNNRKQPSNGELFHADFFLLLNSILQQPKTTSATVNVNIVAKVKGTQQWRLNHDFSKLGAFFSGSSILEVMANQIVAE